MAYKRLSRMGRHFLSPNIWLFGTRGEFFNSHGISRQLSARAVVSAIRWDSFRDADNTTNNVASSETCRAGSGPRPPEFYKSVTHAQHLRVIIFPVTPPGDTFKPIRQGTGSEVGLCRQHRLSGWKDMKNMQPEPEPGSYTDVHCPRCMLKLASHVAQQVDGN
jgi:hypothetical protein